MNIKFILKNISIGLLISSASAALNCESFKSSNSSIEVKECVENDDGEITKLNFEGTITNDILESVTAAEYLKELTFYHSSYDDLDISSLKSLKELTDLDIQCYSNARKVRYSLITENSFKELSNLRKLYLRGCKISENEDLSGLTNLEDFYFSAAFDETLLQKLATVSSLEKLSLYINISTDVTDYSPLKDLEYLTEIKLAHNPSIKRGFTLEGLKNLKKINVDGFDITQANINEFATLDLEELILDKSVLIGELNFEPLTSLNNLKVLTLNVETSEVTIDQIPDAFFSLTSLRNLTITGEESKITTIPDKISQLKSLIHLSLSDNLITEIPEAMKDLEDIEYLDLSYNDIKELPMFINNYYFLEYVDFTANRDLVGRTLVNRRLKYCNYSRTKLCKAKEMNCFVKEEGAEDLSVCELPNVITCDYFKMINPTITIEECVENSNGDIIKLNLEGYIDNGLLEIVTALQSLEDLYIYHTSYDEVDVHLLGNLKKLTKLELHCYSNSRKAKHSLITENSFKNFGNIEKFDLVGCDISENEDFSNLTNLKDFYFSTEISSSLVKKIADLHSLEKLSIYVNMHGGSPNLSPLKDLENLTELTLKHHPYVEISFNVAGLKHLKKIDFHKFTIEQSNIDDISKMENLEELILSESTLTENLDYEPLKNLKNLKILIFTTGNRNRVLFDQIPDAFFSITSLKNLTVIDDDQHIDTIPDSISQLTNLEYLDLNSNNITVIPEGLKELKNLKYLDLNFNDVRELPSFLSDLDLEYVDFSNNENLVGQTLTNKSLKFCNYSYTQLCKAKEMDCFSKREYDKNDELAICVVDECEVLDSYLKEKNIDTEKIECYSDTEKGIHHLAFEEKYITEEVLDKLLSYENVDSLQIKVDGSLNAVEKISQKALNLETLDIETTKRSLNLRPLKNLKNLNELIISISTSSLISLKSSSLKYLTSLEKLSLVGLNISQTNIKEIGKLTNLKILGFYDCRYSDELDYSALKNLKQLEELEFNGYKTDALYDIPSAVYYIKSLTDLTISNQKISRISSNISKLVNLQVLDMRGNRIKSLTSSLNKLTKLQYVNFMENPKLKGKTLTNSNLKTCFYDTSSNICKATDMTCFKSEGNPENC